MAGDFSTVGLIAYLREAALGGHMHPALARSRHKAAEALFAHLTPDEAADLRTLDLAGLRGRLEDLPRGNLRPEVVELYAERLAGALEDYFASLGSASGGAPGEGMGSASPPDARRALENVRLSFNHHRDDVVPIALAADRVVYLHGVPADLTPREARKIARVVQALAWDGEEDP